MMEDARQNYIDHMYAQKLVKEWEDNLNQTYIKGFSGSFSQDSAITKIKIAGVNSKPDWNTY